MHRSAQVKAWCYYESRLLGAHHGLISTYALETLVLYIFNLYHTTLNSSLEVRVDCLDCTSYLQAAVWPTTRTYYALPLLEPGLIATRVTCAMLSGHLLFSGLLHSRSPCQFLCVFLLCPSISTWLLLWLHTQVLHKFLQVFGDFDWDRHCLSLHGPIPLNTLPNGEGKCWAQCQHLVTAMDSQPQGA